MKYRSDKGLLPTGDIYSILDGKVKEALQPSPQGAHHFTRFDQVDQLVGASESDADLGFMARLMTLCSLPRTNPGNRKEYVRHNGPYTLGISAGINNKLPFGNIPRLLLAWICTEAVRTQDRELVLGSSLSEFMRELGMQTSGGSARGDRVRLRNQMDRLFHAHISLIYEDERSKESVNSLVADRIRLWWNPKRPDEPVLWESKIELGEKFFQEIIQHPVPLDMNILKAIKRSSLGLDLFLWLTYRTFSLKRPLRLSWAHLYRQFGADTEKAKDKFVVRDFRKDCLRELQKIKAAWPGLNYATARGVMILSPSKPAIAPTRLKLFK